MIDINEEKLPKFKNDLIYFNGYIPPIIYFECLTVDEQVTRDDFLKSKGLYDDINQQDMEVKKKMRDTDDPLLYMDNVLKEWLQNNQKFKSLFIIK